MNEQNNSQNNNSQSQTRILKNAGYLTTAFILQKILSFLYFVFIARVIGPVDLGLYDPVKSLIPILLIIIDFSLSTVLVREIARTPQRAEEYLSNVLGLKIFFALVILLGMGLFTNFSNYPALTKTILYLDGVVVVLDTFTLTFFAVFRGVQNMKYEALGMIGTQLVTVIIGVLGLKLGLDLRILFVAVVGGSIFNFLFSYSILRKKLKLKIRFAWNKEIIKTFLKIAWPFALAAILAKIYSYADRFLLLAISGQRSVGWYVVANKFTYALEFIPSAFAASVFPAMSAFYISSKENLAKTFEKSMYFLIIIALPISLAIFTLADKIVFSLSGPAYVASALPLRILISGLIFIFLNFPVGAFLNACNRQIVNTRNMAIAVVVNVVINILLIKQYTIVGSSIAALTSGFVLFSLGLIYVNKIVVYNKKFLIITLIKSLFSAAVMAVVLFILKTKFNINVNLDTSPILKNIGALVTLGIYIVIGFVIYLIVLLAVKGFNIKDFRFLYRKLIPKKP